MNIERELEVAARSLLNNYLEKINQEPSLLFPLAESVMQDANEIRRKFSRQSEQVEYVSKKLMKVMSPSLFFQNLFCKAVKDQDFTKMNKRDLLAESESLDFISKVTSGDLWGILHQMILKSIHQGATIEEIFYEHYFVEYASNMLEIYMIEQLSKKPALMVNLKQILIERGGQDVIYQLFIKVLDKFKEKIPLENYQYQKVLRMS